MKPRRNLRPRPGPSDLKSLGARRASGKTLGCAAVPYPQARPPSRPAPSGRSAFPNSGKHGAAVAPAVNSMTSQGTARGRFQRAIHRRHVQAAEMAARAVQAACRGRVGSATRGWFDRRARAARPDAGLGHSRIRRSVRRLPWRAKSELRSISQKRPRRLFGYAARRLACGCQHVGASVQLDAHAADLVRAKARLHRSQNAQHVSL